MADEPKLDQVKPGTKLEPKQSKQLAKELDAAISAIRQRRRHLLLVHDSLQHTIGLFLQMLGCRVEYEVPFAQGGWSTERVIFDIVAGKGKEQLVVEVKDVVTTRDMGQVYGYANALQLSKEKAKLYLGTDILNYEDLVMPGMVAETVRELMERERLGVIFADKYLLLVCDNHAQLTLNEMPAFVPSAEPVG